MSLSGTKEIQVPEEPPNRTQDADTHQSRGWRSIYWQFLRYCLVGGANTLIELLVLNLLLWRFPTSNAQVLALYNSIAYASGALSSFFLNKYWTFRRRHKATAREVIRFTITLLLEVIYSSGLVWLAGKILHPLIANVTLWGNASKLAAVVVRTIISYSFMRFWTFAGGSQDQSTKSPLQHPEAGRE